MSSAEIISIAMTVGIMAVIQTLVFYIYKTNKEKRYDDEKRRIEMEQLRESIEKRIYDLTERMISKEDRWRDVNHLLFDARFSKKDFLLSENKVKPNSFLDAAGLADEDYEVDPKLVFVITPFNNRFSDDFGIISSVCQSVGMKCVRGDEEYIEGDILKHILKKMVSARIVIANINGRNPNVFYELGLAHALEKPTLITSRTVDEIPFDLRTQQLVIYQNKSEFKERLSQALLKLTLK